VTTFQEVSGSGKRGVSGAALSGAAEAAGSIVSGGGNGGGPFGAAVGGAIGGDAGALTGGAISGVLSSQGPTILPPNAPNPTPLGQLEKARQGLSRGLIGAGAGILATEATSGFLDVINNLCEETPCEQ
jgi:hypothetical protein